MKSIGTQIAIDMYNCSDLLLNDASGVQATVQSAAADFSMQPRETYINCEKASMNIRYLPIASKAM